MTIGEHKNGSKLLKITMTLLVRDEEDIIEDNLWFHSEQGIDNFIITDNLSTDKTPEIIKSLSRELDIEYFQQTDDDYNQSKWVTEMARRASRVHAADWVINNDADEFWKAESGTLKTFLSGVSPDVGMLGVKRHNAVLVYGHRDPLTATAHQLSTDVFEIDSLNCLGDPLPRKCIHRASNSVLVAQGNHTVERVPGKQSDIEDDLKILHFPHRTIDHYKHKIMIGGAAYNRNRELPEPVGGTWRNHFKDLNSEKPEIVDTFWKDHAHTKQDVTIGILTHTLFRDPAIKNTLRSIKDRPAEQKILEAVTRLERESLPLAKEVSQNLAYSISRTDKDARPTRPLYYNLDFCISGPERQLENLADLKAAKNPGELCNDFARLRDIYSLFPRNIVMKRFFGELLEMNFPEQFARLRADCDGKNVVLHTSCKPRVSSAEQSIASFARWEDDQHHILLVGEEGGPPEDETELSLKYDGRTLIVPVPDNYESLHRKVFYALMVLDLVTNPKFVLKLDDDLCLGDGPALTTLLEDLASKNIEYAGRAVGSLHHKEQWHGWHLSKCEDETVESRGYQFPLPRRYAAGGYGYVLGRKGLEACSYMYLAMKEFFAMRTIGLEDVYVGHALYAENLDLHDISSEEYILTMPGLVLRHLHGQQDFLAEDPGIADERSNGLGRSLGKGVLRLRRLLRKSRLSSCTPNLSQVSKKS